MKVLLLGGNRFVGVEVLWHLLRNGHTVTVLALDAPPAEARPHTRWLCADRNDEALLTLLLANDNFDVVIDNIAYQGAQVACLLRVLNGRIGHYLLTSTTDCYPGAFPRSYTEDQIGGFSAHPTQPLSPAEQYSHGKLACESVLAQSEVAWTVLRPCVVTGPRDNRNGAPAPRSIHWFEESARSHFWVPRVLDGGPVLLCHQDEVVLKQVWVGDLARAVVHVLNRHDAIGKVFNVTGDELWTNERMVRALAHAAGITPDIVRVPNDLLESAGLDYTMVYGTSPNWTLADNSSLKETGWQPTPAEKWLPFLLETNSPPDTRAWYHTRLAEIALARHVQRHQQARPHLSAIPATPTLCKSDKMAKTQDALVVGLIDSVASRAWEMSIHNQSAATTPSTGFFRNFGDSRISGIGIGTWMGDLSPSTDERYIDTIVHAAGRGINVIDTAINYRGMQAERCVGVAIRRLVTLGVPRQALCITTKGGFIVNDSSDSRPCETYLREEYLATSLIDDEELTRRHAINPAFIARQFEQSLGNLGLAAVDVYYLHNPEELLPNIGKERFMQSLFEVFCLLEQQVVLGRLGKYGLATWHGLRVPPSDPRHLELADIVEIARAAAESIGTTCHHLNALQLPFNIRDQEALKLPTQLINGKLVPALAAATSLGLYCFSSASVLQGNNIPSNQIKTLLEAVPGYSPQSAALHAARSAPGVGTALVGMRRLSSLENAIDISELKQLTESFW
jgi:aryl-alcohol dehydrogenase-like predicted oxidoreductase/nucleoside-diphosphate-sugar epimerase